MGVPVPWNGVTVVGDWVSWNGFHSCGGLGSLEWGSWLWGLRSLECRIMVIGGWSSWGGVTVVGVPVPWNRGSWSQAGAVGGGR